MVDRMIHEIRQTHNTNWNKWAPRMSSKQIDRLNNSYLNVVGVKVTMTHTQVSWKAYKRAQVTRQTLNTNIHNHLFTNEICQILSSYIADTDTHIYIDVNLITYKHVQTCYTVFAHVIRVIKTTIPVSAHFMLRICDTKCCWYYDQISRRINVKIKLLTYHFRFL